MPSEITPNNTYQMVVRRGNALSVPEPVTVVTSRPALFSLDSSGTGQGLVQRFAADGSFSLAEPETPSRAGEALVIFCTGIGPVDPPVSSGEAAPFSPLSRIVLPISAILGEQRLKPFFAGLAPGFVGLYQVNVLLPTDSPTGDQVPLIIEVEGNVSNKVTVAIAP
jgi:uncharacterized protein (TIGR03437 family)